MSTTSLTVLRPQGPAGAGVDPQLASYGLPGDEALATVQVLTGLRAHIGSPSGIERIVNGQQTFVSYRCTADPADIQSRDQIVSSRDGLTYDVATVVLRNDVVGLEHLQMTLTRNEGVAP
jgi:hypothetical protein